MMGYYTYHKLKVTPNDGVDHEQEISATTGYHHCFDGEEIKWYEHEADMRRYSTRYPKHLFKLVGEGEETGDLWVEYYKNGKMQRCVGEVVYPPYDKNKLE